VLRELIHQRRTTLVAQRLGLSQSAVSHALSRLRDLFDDPLFVRKPYGLEPTRHALELAPRIEALLGAMNEALGWTERFTPQTTTRGFRIAAPDHLATLLAPGLLKFFARHAPKARFAFSQRLGQDALLALQRDEIDLALGRFRPRIDGLLVEPLFDDRYCLVARQHHPKLREKLTKARYSQLEHVQISVSGDFQSLEIEPVGALAVPRHALAAVPRFLIALAVVGQTDAVAVAPFRLAKRHAKNFGLRLHALPFVLEPLRVLAVRRPHADPGVEWLFDVVKRLESGAPRAATTARRVPS
jgi:DNA-binding transcriptional LysR family regulator